MGFGGQVHADSKYSPNLAPASEQKSRRHPVWHGLSVRRHRQSHYNGGLGLDPGGIPLNRFPAHFVGLYVVLLVFGHITWHPSRKVVKSNSLAAGRRRRRKNVIVGKLVHAIPVQNNHVGCTDSSADYFLYPIFSVSPLVSELTRINLGVTEFRCD